MGIKRKHIVLAAGMLVFSSCAAGDRSVEARRDFAIRFNKEQLARSRNELPAKRSKDILSALALFDPKAINNPRVASAVLLGRNNGSYGLFVFWIEKFPSADGVEFRLSDERLPVVIPIPESARKWNQSAAKTTVVFGSEFGWKDVSDLWKGLEQVTNAKGMKVRMLQGEAPLTDWFPVSFYKVDRWISDDSTKK